MSRPAEDTVRTTPFHPRTSALCTSFAWKEWAGYAAVCNFDRHSEREYFAFRGTAGLIDITPLHKYEVTGPDAAAFLARVWTRDIAKVGVGRVVYSSMCDADGWMLDDGTITRLGPEHFRVTTSEPWLSWFERHRRGYDVEIRDAQRELAALALQGPRARAVLKPIVAFDMDRMRFFRCRRTQLAGIDVWVSRTGYTGDLGYEIWCANEAAPAVWDALLSSGQPHGIEPCGLDALDVVRIEAGFVLQGCDYVSAVSCITDFSKSTPDDAGLGWTVDLDRAPFIGQRAIRAERARGPTWDLVGLELSWPELEALYASYKLPPHLAPCASRAAVPLYDASGKQVGQMTSSTWSPVLKRYLGLAQVRRPHHVRGTTLQVEHTVEYERRKVTATVVDTPFYDPPRKRLTPSTGKAKASS